LSSIIHGFEKKKWDLIGNKIGMSGEGCKRRADELGLKFR